MIEIKQLSKVYQTNNGPMIALEEITLSVAKGQIFGIIGKSGAGKSTLIRCVNMLAPPSSGTVHIAGVDITPLRGKALRAERRKIGMIFQHFNLLSSKTVFANVALPLKLEGQSKAQIQQRVDQLLDLVGLSDKAKVYPSELSGGQKQRVAIARALASEPDVLLCDEATSALDPHTTQNILTLLHSINQKFNLTIMLITHEMAVIKEVCDHVAVIDQGLIIEQGPVLEIFTQPQHPVTRELINTALRLDIPDSIKNALKIERQPEHEPLIRFTFVGNEASKPFLSKLTEALQIEFSILQANIELLDALPIGIMLVQAEIDDEKLNSMMAFAQQHHVNAEVLGYVR